MANRYTREEWEELKKIIFVEYSLSEDKEYSNLYLDLSLSSLRGSSAIHGVNSLIDYLKKMYYLHHNSKVDSIARNIVEFLTCDFKDVAKGINIESIKNIVHWRLEHGR